MVAEPTVAGWPQSLLDVLSPGLDVVQTYTYIDNVSILEAPIAPEPSGRISR
jgi:hypothetical protein